MQASLKNVDLHAQQSSGYLNKEFVVAVTFRVGQRGLLRHSWTDLSDMDLTSEMQNSAVSSILRIRMETKATDGRITTHCWFDNPSSSYSYSLLLGPTSRASIQTRLVTPFNQFVRGLLARQVIIVFSLNFQHEHFRIMEIAYSDLSRKVESVPTLKTNI